MKLYSAPYAPNPRRVTMFMAEKGVTDIEIVPLNFAAAEQRRPDYLAKNPLGTAPLLEFDDGRHLSESRAICGYLETVYPEPNLMGADADERAFIEMWDRRMELNLTVPLMLWVRHGAPALAVVEKNQTPEVAAFNERQAMTTARWLDGVLADRPWIAGDRFTIADITAAAGIDFARLMRWRPGEDMPHLSRWRAAFAERPAGQVAP